MQVAFKVLEAAVEARRAEHDDYYGVCAAWDFAVANANDTIHVDKSAPEGEFEQLVLDSLSFTAPFDEDPSVRAWYADHGFTW